LTDSALQWWALLFGLGAFHGVNPAMGWLFAVARGMQEESRRAAWWAMVPLAVGHFLAIGAAIAVAVTAGDIVPLAALRWPIGVMLVGLGGYQLVRHRHPRYRGMRVGAWGLMVWSFLMASIHGAGLMVIPLFLGPPDITRAAMATLVHGVGYSLTTALLAGLFYEKIGVGVLRRAWINVDLVWALALILIGVVTLSV
jgi:hypothetical protein